MRRDNVLHPAGRSDAERGSEAGDVTVFSDWRSSCGGESFKVAKCDLKESSNRKGLINSRTITWCWNRFTF